MNDRYDATEQVEFYRGNELNGVGAGIAGNTQTSTGSGTGSAGEAQNGEEDVMNREREEKLELWMEGVKAFIRRIDVNNL